jgi:DNA polymerase III epsilon subunit-like protein
MEALATEGDSLFSGHDGSYVVFDLETTGKITNGESLDDIIEIALLEVDCHGDEIFRWETTLRSAKSSSPKAIAKHKLSQEVLRNSPEFAEIGYWLAQTLNGKMLVAHNLMNFDGKMLLSHFSRLPDLEVDMGTGIDTLPTSSKGWGLDNLREVHYINYLAHSAMGDALTVLTLIKQGVLTPAAGAAPFRLIRTPFQNIQAPAIVPRKDAYRAHKSFDKSPSLSNSQSLSARSHEPIILKPGNKVCLSGGEGDYRRLMEEKHAELELERKSLRSFSKGLVAMVVCDLDSSAAKCNKARDSGIPFIKADDFLASNKGDAIPAWYFADS